MSVLFHHAIGKYNSMFSESHVYEFKVSLKYICVYLSMTCGTYIFTSLSSTVLLYL